MFSKEPLMEGIQAGSKEIEKALNDIDGRCKQLSARLDLMFVILPHAVAGVYGIVKTMCETKLGIISQCCNEYLTSISYTYRFQHR